MLGTSEELKFYQTNERLFTLSFAMLLALMRSMNHVGNFRHLDACHTPLLHLCPSVKVSKCHSALLFLPSFRFLPSSLRSLSLQLESCFCFLSPLFFGDSHVSAPLVSFVRESNCHSVLFICSSSTFTILCILTPKEENLLLNSSHL